MTPELPYASYKAQERDPDRGSLQLVAERPWKNFGMDLLVEKPMTTSKLNAILGQLDGRAP